MPSIPTLLGSAEAAKLLEIGPTNFSHLRRKMELAGDESFPEPITKLQCGPIWRESDMTRFKRHYETRRRRVRSTNGDVAEAPAKAAPKAAPKASKAAAKTAEPKAAPAKARAKRNGHSDDTATVTDIQTKPKRLRVKSQAS